MGVGQVAGGLIKFLLRRDGTQQDEGSRLPLAHSPEAEAGNDPPEPPTSSSRPAVDQRGALSPAFRMAILSGAIESVRLHVRSIADANAADDKGRSALMLAASRGRSDVCKVLLENGADPTLRDQEGNDAMAVAQLRGHQEVVALLSGLARVEPVLPECAAPVAGSASTSALAVDLSSGGEHDDRPDTHAGDIHKFEPVLERFQTAPDTPEFFSAPDVRLSHDEWQEEVEPSAPGDDRSCAESSAGHQEVISRHLPIDRDANWEEVEIELPELPAFGPRHGQFTIEQQRALRMVVLAALRDGRIHEDQIRSALSEAEDDDPNEQAETLASLRLVLADLGVVVDDDGEVADSFVGPDETDEVRFGEIASLALARFWRHQSDASELLTLYLKSLPVDRLSRDDVTRLGKAIEQSMLEVLAIITASAEVVWRVRTDAEAVLRGERPVKVMLDVGGDVGDAEDEKEQAEAGIAFALPTGVAASLTSINSIPLRSKASAIAASVSLRAVPLSLSMFLTELVARPDARARSGWLQLSRARAARIWRKSIMPR